MTRTWTQYDPAEKFADQFQRHVGRNLYVGDRVVIFFKSRHPWTRILEHRLVILERTEDGWNSLDPIFAGYTPEDGLQWCSEAQLYPPMTAQKI